MTRQLEHANAGTPCGKWFRQKLRDSNTGLNIIDVDTVIYFFHDHKQEAIMLVEEKAFGDTMHVASSLSLPILSKLLMAGCKQHNIKWGGLHVLKMSGDRPDNSDKIMWDGQEVTLEQLEKSLNKFCNLFQ